MYILLLSNSELKFRIYATTFLDSKMHIDYTQMYAKSEYVWQYDRKLSAYTLKENMFIICHVIIYTIETLSSY